MYQLPKLYIGLYQFHAYKQEGIEGLDQTIHYILQNGERLKKLQKRKKCQKLK
ncbi:hypothetical protein TTHERM_000149279 (macronuclear) [Tetrahymena thermophila SB210]|uniref:Uncharacterized protein n=1 Tax=Tetrahymena thermophila (strain SB210) TaxID=312017 RepID=W7X6I2_TETTS|nr:hypothetical protein TTHERM_000149279 [Tetrahymena thermophila SB210]EWS73022.1 hypothetical protein TTHERM_000149279 [Tetrahymena thermophila SB210]|eukprot:XP_012654419.1 hypothetical protein TTHERM_000149279 [Tetrahymena thermophila SB210]